MIKTAKTAIVVIDAMLIALVLILVFVLIALDKDPTVYIGSLTTLIGFLASSGVLAALIGTQVKKTDETKEKTDQIAKSVNGNTSTLIDYIKELHAALPAYESGGKHVALDEDRLNQIQADSDALTGPVPVVE